MVQCFESIDAAAGAKDETGRMTAAGSLIECLAALEEGFQMSNKGETSSEAKTLGMKFLSPETTPGLVQWAEIFRALEAVKPYMPTVAEFIEFAKQKFNV
uniref:Uncharacterized protein n=1 Tax=Brassica oleracea var. oleracea TaxID=109376 RepID=A0A0D3APH6_BRAOL